MDPKTQLIERLKLVNATRHERTKLAAEIGNDTCSIEMLIELMVSSRAETAVRAAWILEWICRENSKPILHLLGKFANALEKIKPDGGIRAAAKICEITVSTYEKKSDGVRPLESEIKNLMVVACFRWLIGDYSIAAKTHSMQVLCSLAKQDDWISNELQAVLIQNYPNASAGYQARARKVLTLLKKSQ